MVAVPIWLLWPAKAHSAWKREGVLPKRHAPPELPPPAGDAESGGGPAGRRDLTRDPGRQASAERSASSSSGWRNS